MIYWYEGHELEVVHTHYKYFPWHVYEKGKLIASAGSEREAISGAEAFYTRRFLMREDLKAATFRFVATLVISSPFVFLSGFSLVSIAGMVLMACCFAWNPEYSDAQIIKALGIICGVIAILSQLILWPLD